MSSAPRQASAPDVELHHLNAIIDTSLNGVLACRAVRDRSDGRIIDFQSTKVNAVAARAFGFAEGSHGQLATEAFPHLKESGLFDRYVHVTETGEPLRLETEYTQDGLNGWFDISVTKLGDGFVLNFQDTTATKRATLAVEAQNRLLQGILNTSLNGTVVYEAIRDASGQITDFSFPLFNDTARQQILARTGKDITGSTLLTIYPNSHTTGLFALYQRVTETGEAVRQEHHYPDLDIWYDVSITKLNDGCVVTFLEITAQKKAQQAVEATAAHAQAVIDASQTGIFVFEPVYNDAGEHVDFRFKTINRMVAALVGQTPDVVRGAVASDWFTSYRETGLFDKYKHTFDTGEEQQFDIHYAVDGFDVWFDVKAVKFENNVLVTFTEFTELKKAQQAVERQAELLNSVLNGSINGIMAFRALRNEQNRIVDFEFLSSNDSAYRIINRPLTDNVVGQRLLDLYPGNAEAGLFDLYAHTTETGEPTRSEFYYNHDGLDFWLDISAQKLGDGFVVTFTDVSLIKRAAKAIEQSAEELQTVIDTSQTGIFLFEPVKDDDGNVVDFRFRKANRMLAAYVGQEPAAVIGALGSRWFPDYKTNGLFEAYRHTYLTGETRRFDFHYEGSGIDVWLDIMATKFGDEVLVTFGDYTPLKQLQQQLELSVKDLQRSNENLEQFAYVASHDLQEPLRKIQAFGDIIQQRYGTSLGQEGADLIDRMRQAAARMQALVRDVLAYSRVSSRRDAIRAVDLNYVLKDVQSDLDRALAEKNATLHVAKLPTLSGDAGQLRQLFQNLISNALKFTQPDRQPEIRISSQRVRGGQSGMPVAPPDEGRMFYAIDVQDNGIGFEPSQADRIFQVFQRLHTRAQYEGTGIGLAIVRRVMDNHGGYVRADGRPGEGATFRLLFPA